MKIFGYNTKAMGCFTVVDKSVVMGKGAYITLPEGSSLPSGSGADSTIVTSVAYSRKELYSVVKCFSHISHLYAFGNDPNASMISVTLIAFLTGKGGSSYSDAAGLIDGAYVNNRVSATPEQATVTIGNHAINGFIIGMSSSTASAETNLQQYSLDMIILDDQNSGSGDDGSEGSDDGKLKKAKKIRPLKGRPDSITGSKGFDLLGKGGLN